MATNQLRGLCLISVQDMPPPCYWAKEDTDMLRLGLPLFGKSLRCGGVGIFSAEGCGLA